MAWTSDDLANIEAAIATGALTVKYEDKLTTFRSLAELERIRDMMRAALDAATTGQGTRTRAVFYKDT